MEKSYDPSSWVLLGADLQGLELRMLGHYLSRYDGGEYANEVINGDPHAKTLAAIRDLNDELNRDNAKTVIYAYLYGCGDEHLGFLIDPTAKASKRKGLGKQARKNIEALIPALGKIKADIAAILKGENGKKRDWLIGLDGRRVYTRSEHAALNTLLQSAGALVAKKWIMQTRGLWVASDIIFIRRTWYHDEMQTSVKAMQAQLAGELHQRAAIEAGQLLKLKVPIEASFSFGASWADTH